VIPSSARYEAVKIDKDLIAASASPLVLAILRHGPSYGYAIIQQIREIAGGELEWSEGMLSPYCIASRSMTIESYEERGDTGRKRRY
jgi:DNA-binding PadR family transcriptional regulator